jgi:mono/diheme cytochrome c family protein
VGQRFALSASVNGQAFIAHAANTESDDPHPKEGHDMRLLAFAVLLLATQLVVAQDLDFALGGTVKRSVDLNALAEQIGKRGLQTQDPPRSTPVRFEGLALKAMLDAVYGEEWHRWDAIAFSSRDGYAPSVPVWVIEKSEGLVALNEAGRKGFTAIKQPNGEAVDPGPAYLVWDQASTAQNADWLAWPWQLTRIALQKFTDLYPHATPAADSSTEVQHGFTVFQQHCIRCHQVNGDGGRVSKELNGPTSALEKMSRGQLEQLIRNPRSGQAESNMPAFNVDTPQDQQRLHDLLTYLDYMVKHKRTAN